MGNQSRVFVALAAITAMGLPRLDAAESPAGRIVSFRAPGGTEERCRYGIRIPGGAYSAADEKLEQAYCSIDFHAREVALCPKTWSTSPGTIVYNIAGGRYRGDPASFEATACPLGGAARREAVSELAIYKMSMNERDTSGTFSPASLLYYHLSRYFATEVQVPVAVFRTIDRSAHEQRVIQPGLRYTAGKASLGQIHAGWKHLEDAARNPSSLPSSGEFLAADGRQLFGVLLIETGNRYGVEINGTRTGGWGAGQNLAFQRTPPFVALRQAKPLTEAIRESLRLARTDPAFSRSLSRGVSDAQMVFWMRELSEIVLLDFLLGQQDRVGNIDYEERWYWVRNGQAEHRPATDNRVPPDLATFKPVRLRRTWLNDNDAGVRSSYSDFAEQTHMLDGVAHFGAAAYRRLLELDRDLQGRGPLHSHLAGNYGLGSREIGLIVRRTREATEVLQHACRGGKLRFDLEPQEFLKTGQVKEQRLDCDNP